MNTRSTGLSEQEVNGLVELRDKGLIELDMNYKNTNDPKLDVYYTQTDLGKKAFNFVLDVLFDQFLAATPETK